LKTKGQLKDVKEATVKTLEKALMVLDVIKEANRPIGVNEISRLCSVNLTTTFRILKTLKNGGWVFQDENDKYIIGPKISFVTEKNNFYMALKEIAYYTMARLTVQELQAMNLIIRENEKCYILQQSRTHKLMDYIPPVGTYLPVYASAGGKILLSELPNIIVEKLLDIIDMKPLTKNTITSRAALIEELKKVKQNGYALDVHETQDDGFCIAVPIRNKEGDIIAALSFSGIIGIVPESKIEYYYHILTKASAEITENLYKLI
jgi:DNA-binding IclR family transcriptional regulator